MSRSREMCIRPVTLTRKSLEGRPNTVVKPYFKNMFKFKVKRVCIKLPQVRWQKFLPPTTLKPTATMPETAVPQHQIETRAKNKTTHPGKAVKFSQRQTKVEVQQEKDAKAQAKLALAEARQQSINCTAEFEHANVANEDMVNVTPCPNFTPNPRPLIHNPKKSPLISFSGKSNIRVSNNLDEDETVFTVPSSKNLHGSAVESEGPPPLTPAKKGKAKPAQKTTA